MRTAGTISGTVTRKKVRADLEAEKIGEAEAGGLYSMIEADIADLGTIHRQAQERIGEAFRQVSEAEAHHNAALVALARAEASTKFNALREHVQKLDIALCDAVADLAELARRTGQPNANGLTQLFQPSPRLRNMLTFGQVPRRGPA